MGVAPLVLDDVLLRYWSPHQAVYIPWICTTTRSCPRLGFIGHQAHMKMYQDACVHAIAWSFNQLLHILTDQRACCGERTQNGHPNAGTRIHIPSLTACKRWWRSACRLCCRAAVLVEPPHDLAATARVALAICVRLKQLQPCCRL